jgi:hypothetical protein
MLQSDQPAPLVEEAIERNDFRLRIRFRAALPVQSGPARIFTVSADPYFRNLTVAQEFHDLIVRLRTPSTTDNGLPPYIVPDVFVTYDWHEMEVSIKENELNLTLNGLSLEPVSLPQKPLQNWDPGYRTALGNELTWDRAWLGEISEAKMSVGSHEIDLLRAATMELPAGFWAGRKWQLIHPRSFFSLYRYPADVLFNFLGFVPVGFLLVMVRSRPRIVGAVCVIALASLCVELAQLCFVGRYPSALDWIMNVAGGGVGAWLASRLNHRFPVDDPGEMAFGRVERP